MRTILLRLLVGCIILSLLLRCQRQLSFSEVNPDSEGVLQKNSAGNCQLFNVHGNFTKDLATDTSNWIEANLVVTRGGRYDVHSNEVNGFSFSATGRFDSAGIYLVRLTGKGKPSVPGHNEFTISYGTSTCKAIVNVLESPVPPAQFTLIGAPVDCMNPIVSGDIVAGQNLDTSCKVVISIKVTVPGIYAVTTNTVNGYHFEGTDTVKFTGDQKITLYASGKPVKAGTDLFRVIFGNSSCGFPASPLAAFKALGSDYFPLSAGSYWVYDYPGYTNDSLTRKISGLIKIENKDYVIVQEKNPFRDLADFYFRKTISGYSEFGNPSKYTETISYVPGTTGEIPILELSAGAWASPVYLAKASFGQVIKLRYQYTMLEPDGVAIINGRAFEHVIKVKMTVGIAAENYSEGATGETHFFYFAKGVGLIYTRLMNNQRTVYEQKLRDWKVF